VVYNNTAYHSGSGNPSLDAAICQITNPDGSRPFRSYCAGVSKNRSAGNDHATAVNHDHHCPDFRDDDDHPAYLCNHHCAADAAQHGR